MKSIPVLVQAYNQANPTDSWCKSADSIPFSSKRSNKFYGISFIHKRTCEKYQYEWKREKFGLSFVVIVIDSSVSKKKCAYVANFRAVGEFKIRTVVNCEVFLRLKMIFSANWMQTENIKSCDWYTHQKDTNEASKRHKRRIDAKKSWTPHSKAAQIEAKAKWNIVWWKRNTPEEQMEKKSSTDMNNWQENIERRYSVSLRRYIITMCSRFIILVFVYLALVVSRPFAYACRHRKRFLHRFAWLPIQSFIFFVIRIHELLVHYWITIVNNACALFCVLFFLSSSLHPHFVLLCVTFSVFLFICVHYSFDSIWCYVLVVTYMRAR